MTRIGVDVKFTGGSSLLGADPLATLDAVAGLGFEGILVRTVDEAFPELDPGAIGAFARAARDWGMFVQLGVGKVNPYMTAELPRVRDLGGGSYLAGMERLIRLCAEHGWTEAWTATGGFKPYPGLLSFDRFRTDADWADQLAATGDFLLALAPVLREHGVRLNIETHEEITTFEILRLIDLVGADVLGVCLDPANLVVRGEPVGPAVARVAPYTRMTHLRDAILADTGEGLSRFLMPIGQGMTDWPRLLDTLLGARPEIDLVIEGIGGSRAEMSLLPDDPRWWPAHPDMTPSDLEELRSLAARHTADAAAGRRPGLGELRSSGPAGPELRAFLGESLACLRALLDLRNPTLASEGELPTCTNPRS
ncbi:xylose isomerase [Nonomuraea sp. WAC 01424]|uniref:sugar phosphate isomerase/epimerase family protein n=1 Tax=Nonomuraea sp. WAC 01424 TaxID=2203200 RepID=UPI000F7B632A|nr:sugar phosphate isomerase/epimerase family protein [Nonomuraea sp. WAC 01424]RSN11581.1 xylose isomerase [Nonomuraea sp. WAC 01424]